MNRLIPDTIALRTLIVMILGLGISHAVSVALYSTDRISVLRFSGGEHVGERIATIDRLVRNSSDTERQRLIRIASDPQFQIVLSEDSLVAAPLAAEQSPDEFREALLAHVNPDGRQVVRIQFFDMNQAASDDSPAPAWPVRNDGRETVTVSMALPDAGWLNFAVPIDAPEPTWSFRFGLSMAIMLSAVALLSILMVHHISRPLATFARAAHRLGVDVEAPPIPESGPAEVRKVTRAFNDMQRRIQRFVEDRTQMIAAISHDLGTPITRMRLRAEFIEDEEQRQKMLADLDDMEKMTLSALSFVRGDSAHEPQAMVDLRTVLRRISDDANDMGHTVTLDVGKDPVPFGCRPVALRRAIGNLVENAIRYGRQAHLTLQETASAVLISIDDEGPGIAEDRLEDVFKPFHRLENSRNRETGGTGLGLTVARTIVRAHGGGIALINRDAGGLRVRVTLPR